MSKKKPIDNKEVLNYYFDDRETFVVDYDVNLVTVDVSGTDPGTIIFKLKK